jgi:hypothetical protein
LNSPPTLPITTPAAPVIDSDTVQLLRDTLQATNRRNAQLEEQLARGREIAPPAPRERTSDEIASEASSFFSDPLPKIRNVIREVLETELKATVDPLNQFVREFKGATVIDRLVVQYKTDPRFAPQWDNGVEQYIREQAATVQPQQLEGLFGFIVTSAIGMKATGMISTPGPKLVADPPTPAPRNEPVQPPFIRSTPIMPDPAPRKSTVRALNEDEVRLLREYNNTHKNKLTPEQYIQLQELPKDQVATSMIGIPEKK